MQRINCGLVVLDLICHLLVLLQQSLDIALILANVITGDKFKNVKHPAVNIISISEELMEVNSICESSLSFIHKVNESIPHLSDLLNSLLNFLTSKVSLLDKLIS